MFKTITYILINVIFSTLLLAEESKEVESTNNTIYTVFLVIAALFLLMFAFKKRSGNNEQTKKKKFTLESASKAYKAAEEEAIATPDENLEMSNEEAKELISFLKINTDEIEIKNRNYRVQDLLDEIYGLATPAIEENNIELIYNIDTSVPIELVGDSVLLEQVLYNLLSHSIQDTKDCNAIVKIRKVDDNNYIQTVIEIVNTKKFIPASDISSLLSDCNEDNIDKNAQEYEFCSAKKIIDLMNGSLTIRSQESNGTTYHITLPFITNEYYQEAHYSLSSDAEGRKILLIEDNTHAATAVKEMLQSFNQEVDSKNYTNIHEIKGFDHYDIVILDTKRPNHAFLRQLEEIKDKNNIKILSLESFNAEAAKQNTPNKFVDKFIYRPLTKSALYDALYNLFEIKSDKSTIESHDTTLHDATKSGEIVFIEETLNIKREDFQDFNDTHVLLVEDNEINQRILQSVLGKSDIRLSIANNGKEALEHLNSHKAIDMVLMDINMPIMDGYEATKRIRENSMFHSIPVVVLSALNFRNEIEKMYIAGADAHLTKPFKIGQLYTAFKEHLEVNTTNHSHKLEFVEDKNVLDTDIGVEKMKNVVRYRDTLRETLVILKNSENKVKEMIIKKELTELASFAKSSLADASAVGATGLSHVLNEMLTLVNNNEEQLLKKYILLYRDEWIKTKRNIELYLKSVDAL